MIDKKKISIFSQKKNFFFFILLCLYPWFLISGPFLADGIAVLISLYYVLTCITKKNYEDFKKLPFVIFIIFFVYIFFNSIFIGNNIVSIKSSIFFFRFGFFALAISFLLSENKNYLNYFFLSFLISLSLLFFDSIFQKIYGFNIIGINMYHSIRVSSFFGEELILGSFVVKIIPIILVYLYVFYKDISKIYSLIIILISLIIILLSAEKTSLILMIIFSLLFFAVIDFSNKLKILIVLGFISIILSIVSLNEPIKKRIYHQLISNSGSGKYIYTKMHDSHFRTAYKMFIDKPIFGHGPKMFRFKCSDEKYNVDKFSCSTHPHNFILQILSETGLVGLCFLIIFYISIIKIFLRNLFLSFLKKDFSYPEYILSTSLLVIFFPLATSGNIFNNWISCTHFLTIGILLFFLNSKNDKKLI